LNAILTTAGALAGKELFKKAAIDVYQFIVQQTGRKIKQWNTDRQIEKLYQQIGQVRKVKTIWQIDKAVDLLDFYCDSQVILNDKRCKVSKLSDFKTKDNILIQGIAGQGKSILLRYLCSVELGRGEYIPIFLELRRVSQSYTLKDRIFIAFKSLKLDIDDEIFTALAASGKIVLLLDAFDEVPDDLKSRVLTEIEDLIATKPNIRVIITSRPHQDIRFSNYFNVVVLDNLQGDEYKNVIKKLAHNPVLADTLIEHIANQARHIVDLLCTPLMVTLLVLSYKSYKQLPAKLSDFYDSLFQALLQRHDGTKPGFTRKRSCALDDSQYRQVFETLCILAKRKGQQSFNGEQIYSLSQQALQQCDLQANPSSYIDDIVKITCLVVRDGEEYRFIHKTVQEYYTASYIRKKPESWAVKLYKRLQNNVFKWREELEFLSEIDSYRYNKYLLLPVILNILNLKIADLDRLFEDVELPNNSEFLSSFAIRILRVDNNSEGIYFMNEANILQIYDFLDINYRDIIHNIILGIKRAGPKIREIIKPINMKETVGMIFYSDNKITFLEKDSSFYIGDLEKMGLAHELSSSIRSEYKRTFCKAQEILKSTKDEENSSLLEGLL
jgi:hypothetical protein